MEYSRLKIRKRKKKKDYTNQILSGVFFILLGLGAGFKDVSAIYITLNRNSPDYVLVKGELNRPDERWVKSRVHYEYKGAESGLQASGLLLSRTQLMSLHKQLGYIPVCVDKDDYTRAAVHHELTLYGILSFLFDCLLLSAGIFLFSYFLWKEKRGNQKNTY